MKIKANGITMNYEMLGSENAPVVVFSHSLGSSISMWDPQINLLTPHFRVLLYDTRGHGGTDVPSGAYTMAQLEEDAICLIDELGIDVFHWVGLSMGGMIGQGMALKHPERLTSLALCDTTAFVPEDSGPIWQERIDTARSKGMEALCDETMERWFTKPFLDQDPPAVEMIRKQFLATPPQGFIGCSEAIRKLNYIDRLKEIKAPTLIMVGENDMGTPVEASEAMHERIPNSRLEVLSSAAHLSNIEQSEIFNKNLLDFLIE
jgi:3-oxoadipate enol-lactonase